MATGGLYGQSSAGIVSPQSGSESSGLYGNNTVFGGTYFEWFIFQVSDTAPATPTGGSWSFTTNSGTPPTGWLATPPANPTNTVWVSVGIVNSKSTTPIVWSTPGKFSFASGLPILSGASAPLPGDGQSDQLYIETGTTPETIWFKQAGTWTRLTGSSLYVDLSSNQTIGGTKTFSSQIQGSISGNAANVTGIVDITHGGTGSTTASAARTALGAAASGANSDITSLSGLTTPLSITQGGTGANTSADARTNLGVTATGSDTTYMYRANNLSDVASTSTARTNLGLGTIALQNANSVAITGGSIAGSSIDSTTVGATTASSGKFTTLDASTGFTLNSQAGTAGQILSSSGSGAIPTWIDNYSTTLEITVRNETGSTIPKGSVVYISGRSGSTPLIRLAKADALSTSQAVGFTKAAMNNNTNASIVILGELDNVDTSGYAPGTTLYLSPTTAGAFTDTKPTSPNYAVRVGFSLYNNVSAGQLFASFRPVYVNASDVIGQIAIANGGTNGTATPTAGAISYGTGTAYAFNSAGTANQILQSNGAAAPTWVNLSSLGVSTFSGGTTGLTPSIATTGAITLSGTLAVANGGTGVTTSTGSGSVVLSTSPTLVTPVLGTPASGNFSTGTFTWPTFNQNTTGNAATATTATNVSGGTASVTTLTASSTVTLSGGTANGVGYLNGSKVLTTGSALTFDGTKFGIGGTAIQKLSVFGTVSNFHLNPDSAGNVYGYAYNDAGAAYTSLRWDASNHIFLASGTEGMRLTSTGLGIGTSSPAVKLDVRRSGTGDIAYFFNGSDLTTAVVLGAGSDAGYIDTGSVAKLAFRLNGTEAMRLQGGNLGLGVTPSAWDTYAAFELPGNAFLAGYPGQLQLGQNAYYASGFWRYKSAATAAASRYYQLSGQHIWMNAGTGTAGNQITWTQAMTLDASGNLGVGTTSPTFAAGGGLQVKGSGFTSVRVTAGAYIGLDISQTQTTGDAYVFLRDNAPLIFGTNNTERARIDSSGNLLVGITSSTDIAGTTNTGFLYKNKQLQLTAAGTVGYLTTSLSGSQTYLSFYSQSTATGSITTNGSTTSYVTTSDYRLKESVQPMQGALAKVAELKPVTYTWKATGRVDEGFIAHELQEVCPSAVSGQKDAVDAEGNPVYQGIDTSFLVATLTAAIQEQQAIIEDMKSRLAAAGI